MPYADLNNLIADYLPEAKSTKEIAAVTRILESSSAFVDSYCKRPAGYFSPSPAEPAMKRVRGEGQNFLRLPRHVFGTVEEVKRGESVIESSVYYESDVNNWLYLEENNSALERSFSGVLDCLRWFNGETYKVVARWGYAATPLPIVEAVRLITARIYGVQKGTIGQVTTEGFINERMIPQAAKDLMQQYIKREFEI